jgi:hypothetical protein
MNDELVIVGSPIPVDASVRFTGPMEAFLSNELDSLHSRRHIREGFRLMGVASVGQVTDRTVCYA